MKKYWECHYIVKFGQIVPPVVEIALTDLPNLGGGGSDPPGPSSSGITAALLISPPTMNTFLFLIIKANFEYYLYRPLFILPLNKRIKSHMRLTTMQSIILLLNGFKSMRHHIIMQKMLIQLSICQTVITL